MVKETLEKFERPNSEKKEVIHRKLDEIDKINNSNDSTKGNSKQNRRLMTTILQDDERLAKEKARGQETLTADPFAPPH